MPTNSILRLKAAFANIPMKGLFFWESLLALEDDQYKRVIEENFVNVMNSFPAEEKDLTACYKKILEDLKKIRNDITKNPQTKIAVEKIREALIAEAAHEKIINDMKDNIIKQESN